MLVISSLRRSGSSMLMYALKEAGLNIIGDKFYNKTDNNIKGNPNGYWEVDEISTNTGLQEKIDGDAIKIMFEALSNSKPELIDKLVLIFREPRKMLASVYEYNDIEHKDMFVCKQAVDIVDSLSWITYFNKQFRIVFYEDILKSPRTELRRLIKFTGGEYKNVVDKKLDRSKPIKDKSKYIDLLEDIYKHLKTNEIDKVLSWRFKIMDKARELMDNFDKTRC